MVSMALRKGILMNYIYRAKLYLCRFSGTEASEAYSICDFCSNDKCYKFCSIYHMKAEVVFTCNHAHIYCDFGMQMLMLIGTILPGTSLFAHIKSFS